MHDTPDSQKSPARTELHESPGSPPVIPEARRRRLELLQRALETQLEKIEAILGPQYRLTLVANYQGDKDADLVLTMSTRERILAAIDRFLPASGANTKVSRTGANTKT
jgi:hypothetical protein